MQIRNVSKYGWIPNLPDYRDYKFEKFIITENATLPSIVDLRPYMPEVYDQGSLGSCTGNAIAGAIHYDQNKNKNKYHFTPSRLYIYYQERAIEGTINSDSGAMIRDGIKACAEIGVCPEYKWPYNLDSFAVTPTAFANESAIKHKIKSYYSVNQNINSLKSALAKGYPFVFGFSVYSYFESDEMLQSGVLKMPDASQSFQGGHAVLCCGYDDSKQMFLVRNSWGSGWGPFKGYFWMPYSYISDSNLASDFWVIDTITDDIAH